MINGEVSATARTKPKMLEYYQNLLRGKDKREELVRLTEASEELINDLFRSICQKRNTDAVPG